MPTAPLSPAQVDRITSLKVMPQPMCFRMGQKVMFTRKRMTCKRGQVPNTSFTKSIQVMKLSIMIRSPKIRPVKMKMMVSAMNPMQPHTWWTACSLSAEILVLPDLVMQRPRATKAKIPLTCNGVYSAMKKIKYATKSVEFTSRTKLLWILLNMKVSMMPPSRPRMGPPTDSLTNLTIIYPGVNSIPLTRSSKTRKRTNAVPSFSKLSPSIRVESFFDAPNCLRRTTTATGSVADTMDPKRRASVKVNSIPSMIWY